MDPVQVRLTALQALEMRKAGHSYQEIADQFYHGARGNAYTAIKRLLKRTEVPVVAEYRALENMRLDMMLAAIWPDAVHKPEAIEDSDDREERKRKRKGADLWAQDRILAIMERRARLLGLDTPVAPVNQTLNAGVVIREFSPAVLDGVRGLLGGSSGSDPTDDNAE